MHERQEKSGASWRQSLEIRIESPVFQHFITIVILFNAVCLGLETSPSVMQVAGGLLHWLDKAALAIFVAELLVKLIILDWRFFRSAWNVFDLCVVSIALIPATGSLSVLRTLRVLRVLRLISSVPSMRRVVEALVEAIPSMGSVISLLGLFFYVSSVLATRLYGDHFPQWFGTIGESAYSLFQIMTLESWSMGIVRPVMNEFPFAWLFFVPFVLVTCFVVLNLFIGIIVDAMQTVHLNERKQETKPEGVHDMTVLLSELKALRIEVMAIQTRLEERTIKKEHKNLIESQDSDLTRKKE